MTTATTNPGSTERAQRYAKAGDVRPALLLMDEQFTAAEKRWILEQCVLDLDAKLRASQESMNGNHPGAAGERLREAKRALLVLDEGDGKIR